MEELTLGGTDKYWRELVKELDQLNQKLHVKRIHTSSNFDLHYLDPGEIEEITVFLRDPKAEEIQMILESEQYKSARMTNFETHVFPSKFPFECFYKCPKFTLTLGGQPALKIKWDFIKVKTIFWRKISDSFWKIEKFWNFVCKLLARFLQPRFTENEENSVRNWETQRKRDIFQRHFDGAQL